MIIFKEDICSLKDVERVKQRIYEFRLLAGYTGWPIFRGQADENWAITPSIVRSGKAAEELRFLEPKMINEFKSCIAAEGLSIHFRAPYSNSKFHEAWLAIQQAQHFRLPTRLIDWTIKENIALSFAIIEPEYDDRDGALFLYFADSGETLVDEEPRNYLDEDPYHIVNNNDYLIISPSTFGDENMNIVIAEKRIRKQGGKFIVQDYGDIPNDLSKHDKFSKKLYKFIIPKENKALLREELEGQFKVSLDTLYDVEHIEINEIVRSLRFKYGV